MIPEEAQRGPVEAAVRREISGNTALAELAYKLAREVDLNAGGVAAIRELRAILVSIKQQRGYVSPAELLERRKAKRKQAKWAMMTEGKWEWSDEQDDWIRVDDD